MVSVMIKIQLDRQEEPIYILRVFPRTGSFTIPNNSEILGVWLVK